jgi:hypothetical protein
MDLNSLVITPTEPIREKMSWMAYPHKLDV